jgi:helicase
MEQLLSTETNPFSDLAEGNLHDVLWADRCAAALSRGLEPVNEADRGIGWAHLIEVALDCLRQRLGECELRLPGSLERLYDQARERELVAACRVLDAAAQAAPQNGAREARHLGLLSALAFAALGNFPTAATIVRRTLPTLRPKSEREAAFAVCAAPSLMHELRWDASWAQAGAFRSALGQFLASGRFQDTQPAREGLHALEPVDETDTQNELCVLLSAWALEHALHLSTARALGQAGPRAAEVSQRLCGDGLSLLLPPQRRALVDCEMADARGNAVIALPPGTGKTLLGEMCAFAPLLAQSHEKAAWSVFLVPYVALGRQVAAVLKRHAPDGAQVLRALGGDSLAPRALESGSGVIVATPERFDALLRSGSLPFAALRTVVCDEAHSVGDGVRGLRLEGLVTRLLAQQASYPHLRIVLLSASVREPKSLARWVGAAPEMVIADRWCPTARRIAIWTSDGQLSWHTGEGRKRPRAGSPEDEGAPSALPPTLLGQRRLAWPRRDLRPSDEWLAVRKSEPAVWENVSHLVAHLHESFGGAVLCVCATKRGARLLACSVARLLPPRAVGPHTQKAIDCIRALYRHLLPLVEPLQRGAAWHHAGLPPEVREAIEAALKSGEIATVAATTTLAEGVDFPFRWTILADWMQWTDGTQAPMSRWLFRNIVGRCGRAGAWTEGDTIVLDNPLGDRRYTEMPQRQRWIEHLCLERGPSEPRSVLGSESWPPSEPLASARAAMAGAQFLAALVEAPSGSNASTCCGAVDTRAAVEGFWSRAYAGTRSASPAAVSWLEEKLREWAGGEEPLLAWRGGRFEATPLGLAVYRSHLSPESATLLRAILRDEVILLAEQRVLDADGPEAAARLGARLCLEMGDVPEQNHTDWTKVAGRKRNRFVLKRADVREALDGWLRGDAPEALFARLPAVQASRRPLSFDAWFEGATEAAPAESEALADAADWQADVDKWNEWLRSVPETFLPLVLRASAALAPTAASSEDQGHSEAASCLSARCSRWALWFEQGLSDERAITWRANGTPITRTALAELARRLPPGLEPSDRRAQSFIGAARRALGSLSGDAKSLDALVFL